MYSIMVINVIPGWASGAKRSDTNVEATSNLIYEDTGVRGGVMS